jgi:tRNA pseudouridine38-40 synthase
VPDEVRTSVPTFKITLAYDGTGFVGWQRQAAGTSIQGLLEDALRDLDQRDVPVAGAGRTDAGVHALGQVASFTLDRLIEPATLVRAVNARLPASVRIVNAEQVDASFHARFCAVRKTYWYRIWNARPMSPFERAHAWHVPEPLDVRSMMRAADHLAGRHDFSAFQAAGSSVRSSERELFHSSVRADRTLPEHGLGFNASTRAGRGALIVYEVSGDGFLRHMVRAIVGSLVEVGRGRRPAEWMAEVLESRDRRAAGPTAPPQGLVLFSVEYGSDGRPHDPAVLASGR